MNSMISKKADNGHNHDSVYAKLSHTHAISDITNLQSTLNGKASSNHTHPISDITNLQSTLDGKASSNHTHAYLPLSGGTLTGNHVLSPYMNWRMDATGNNNEWSFDFHRNGYTGCYWHVWDSSLNSLLTVKADNGFVIASYGFDTASYHFKGNSGQIVAVQSGGPDGGMLWAW